MQITSNFSQREILGVQCECYNMRSVRDDADVEVRLVIGLGQHP